MTKEKKTRDRREYFAAYRQSHKKEKREYSAAYRKANAKNISASMAAYYQKNKERILARCAAWAAANPNAVRTKYTTYRKANQEKTNAASAAWRKANPEKERAAKAAWNKAHPEETSAHCANRRARIKGSEGKHTALEIGRLLARQKCRCAVCRKSIEDGYHKDHIVPLARGGSNCIRNIQLLCPTCNCKKGSKHPIKFMQEMGYLL